MQLSYFSESVFIVANSKYTFLFCFKSSSIWAAVSDTAVDSKRRIRSITLKTPWHQNSDVMMSAMVSQITSHTIVCSTIYSGTDQRKYQSSASPAFVRWIHRWPVNCTHKGPVTRKMFPFDDVIMKPRVVIMSTSVLTGFTGGCRYDNF